MEGGMVELARCQDCCCSGGGEESQRFGGVGAGLVAEEDETGG